MTENVDLATVTMKPSQVAEALVTMINMRQPVFLWGPPGVGKSGVTQQVTMSLLGWELRDVRAVLLDPVDLRGIPIIKNGLVHWAPPAFWPRDGKGVLFLDELPAAPQLTQAGLYQLILPPHQLGEYQFPIETWSIVAAGNRETDRAVVHRMPSPLANRFVHINFEPDLDDWKVWAFANDISPEVIAFLTWKESLLFAFDPTKNEKAFPTPRSWEFTSNILKTNGKAFEFPLIAGTVGPGPAAELMGFIKIYRSLPDPRQVIANPMGSPVPEKPDVMYALCGALTSLCDKRTFGSIVKYSSRIPADFSVLLIRDCTRKDKSVLETKHFINWAADNADVVL